MDDDLSKLRNFGIIAHIDAGKTTLTEGILFCTGRRHRIGHVDDGDTITDWQPEERERGITITAAAVTSFWRNHKLNLIDTPGHVDFTAEVERSLRVLDGAVVVFCGVAGVQAQSETVWRIANRYGVPRVCFINKLDRIGADFEKAVEDIEERLSIQPLPIQIPEGLGDEFRAVIDLVRMKRLEFDWDRSPQKIIESDLPESMQDEAELARLHMIEVAAESSDELLELFLNEETNIPEELLWSALRQGTLAQNFCPVLCGSALNNKGVEPVLDAIVELLPSPADLPPVKGTRPRREGETIERNHKSSDPLSGLIFKTATDEHGTLAFFRVYSGTLKSGSRVFNPGRKVSERINKLWRIFADKREEADEVSAGDIAGVVGLKKTVTGDTLCDSSHPILLEKIAFPQTIISISVEPRTSADQADLEAALEQMVMDDPTLEVRVDDETGQTLLSGMGELHLEIIKDRLLREHKLNVRVGRPRVRYRETISRPAEGAATFEREIGERHHKATVRVAVAPIQTLDYQVESLIDKSQVPLAALEAMQESLKIACGSGPLEGYPLLRLRVTVLGVEDYDSAMASEIALCGAAVDAFEAAIQNGAPIPLEPIMRLELNVHGENVGDVLFDLGGRRAEVQETEVTSEGQRIHAICPLSELFGYATQYRSLTRGRGELTIEPSDYRSKQ